MGGTISNSMEMPTVQTQLSLKKIWDWDSLNPVFPSLYKKLFENRKLFEDRKLSCLLFQFSSTFKISRH
jgi:hypothetical protein